MRRAAQDADPASSAATEAEPEARVDVVVVGAGPAGSVAACALAREGLDVLLVERRLPGEDKVCGGCLSPAALEGLARLDLIDVLDEAGALPLREVSVHAGGRALACALPEGRVIARGAFDAALARAARRAGARRRPGTSASIDVEPGEEPRVTLRSRSGDVERLRARLVLAAGGLLGRRGARVFGVGPRTRIGVGAVLPESAGTASAPPPGRVVMAWSPAGYAGTVRLPDGRWAVACALDLRAVLGSIDRAVRALFAHAGVPPPVDLDAARWRGAPLLGGRAHAGGDRVFAIGDAAGAVEPFSGEGIARAIASAHAVVPYALRALDGWSPVLVAAWEARRAALAAQGGRVRATLAALRRHPHLTRAAFALLAGAPRWRERVVRAAYGAPAAATRTLYARGAAAVPSASSRTPR